jgi:hypothetical protein
VNYVHMLVPLISLSSLCQTVLGCNMNSSSSLQMGPHEILIQHWTALDTRNTLTTNCFIDCLTHIFFKPHSTFNKSKKKQPIITKSRETYILTMAFHPYRVLWFSWLLPMTLSLLCVKMSLPSEGALICILHLPLKFA